MTDAQLPPNVTPNLEEIEAVWVYEDYINGLCRHSDIGRLRPDPHMARRLAQRATPIAMNALIDVAQNSDHSGARVKAANSILDRGFGRPEAEERHVITVESHTRSIEEVRQDPAFAWLSAKRLSYQVGQTLIDDIEANKTRVEPRAAAPAPPADAPAEAAPAAVAAPSPISAPTPFAAPSRAATEPRADIRRDYGPRGSAH